MCRYNQRILYETCEVIDSGFNKSCTLRKGNLPCALRKINVLDFEKILYEITLERGLIEGDSDFNMKKKIRQVLCLRIVMFNGIVPLLEVTELI